MISFKEWLFKEFAGTGAIYDGSKGTFNWEGAPGSTGKSIEGWPIGTKEDKKEKKLGKAKKRKQR